MICDKCGLTTLFHTDASEKTNCFLNKHILGLCLIKFLFDVDRVNDLNNFHHLSFGINLLSKLERYYKLYHT